MQQYKTNKQYQHKMKTILIIVLILISPFITMALLSIIVHLVQWASKQLDKLKKYKVGKVFANIVSFIASAIGFLIMAILYLFGTF